MIDPKPIDENEFARRLEQVDEAVRTDRSDELAVSKSDEPGLDAAAKVVQLLRRIQKHRLESDQDTVAGINETPTVSLEIAESHAAPKKIATYEIREQIGQGGYGLVFLAYDPVLQRDLAIKIPRPESIVTPSLQARFLREAKAAASLSHPNIVPVYEAASEGPFCYIASKYISGPSLDEWMENQSDRSSNLRRDEKQLAGLIRDLADALHHAHQRGVLHRDLKPSNILLETESSNFIVPLITDFGLAKLNDGIDATQTGAVIGTPAYMAPEQTIGDGAKVDARSDIFSLGAVLYELLTGVSPFAGDNILETLKRVRDEEPAPPSRLAYGLAKDLEAICLKCLEKDPKRRYASAFELQQDLQRFLDDRPVVARPVTFRRRTIRFAQRNPLLASTITFAVSAVVIGLITTTILWLSADHLRRQSDANHQVALEKSRQLQGAVDELLVAIAETPEIKLRGMERLRQELLERANGFYASFLSEMPTDPKLADEHRSILLQLASIRAELGDRDGALELAQQIIDQLGEHDSPRQRQLLVQAYLIQARQLARLNRANETESILHKACDLARESASSETDSDAALVESAVALQQAAEIYVHTGHRTRGNELILESVDIWQQVDPDFVKEHDHAGAIGQALVTAGQALASSEDKQRALPFVDQAIPWLELLETTQSPALPGIRASLAKAYQVRGFLHDKDFANAQLSFERATELLLMLTQEHPLVPDYHRQLAAVAYSRGLSLFLANRNEDDLIDATAIFRENIERCEELVQRFSQDKAVFERVLGDNLTMLGHCYGKAEEYEKKLETLQQSRQLVAALHEASGGRPDTELRLAGIDGDIGKCLISLNRFAEASEVLAESQRRLEEILNADPDNGQARRYLSNNFERSAAAFAAVGDWNNAAEHQALSLEYYWRDKRDKCGPLVIYLLHDGQIAAAHDSLQQYLDDCVEVIAAGEIADPAEVADIVLTTAEVLQIISQRSGDDREDVVVLAELATHAAMVCLAWFDEATQDDDCAVLDDLLANPLLTSLKETSEYQQWAMNRQ